MTSADQPLAPRQETSRHAITAMVFAVAGLLWLVVVGPVLALVFAGKAARQLDQEPGRPGRELAASARTVAVVGLVLQAVVLLVGLALALLVAVTARDAVETSSRSAVPAPADAGAAFTQLCQDDLKGDAGACGCALVNVRQQGISDAVLGRDVAEYRTTGVVPDRLAGPLSACGVGPR